MFWWLMFCCVYVWFAFGGLRVYLIASGYGFIVLGWLGLVYVFWVCVMFIGCFRVVVLLVVLFVLVVLFDFLCDWYVILFEFVVVCWYYWVGCGCWLTCFVFCETFAVWLFIGWIVLLLLYCCGLRYWIYFGTWVSLWVCCELVCCFVSFGFLRLRFG